MQSHQLDSTTETSKPTYALNFTANCSCSYPNIFNSLSIKNKPDEPKAKEIFNLFKFFAENPSSEMLPRFYMQNKKRLDNEVEFKDSKMAKDTILNFDNRTCGFTMGVLQCAIFGCDPALLLTYEFDKQKFSDLESRVKENGDILNELSKSHFFSYFIGFSASNPSKTFSYYPSHGFTVIQQVDDDANLTFSVFQSYISQTESYTLKEYIDQNNNVMTSMEFSRLINFISSLMKFEHWTEETTKAYENYFKVNEFKIGSKNIFNRQQSEFYFSYGLSNMRSVTQKSVEFREFKAANSICERFKASF